MRYVAILRGVNSSGNTKVSMSDLKACFETQGFTNVSTIANSGNVLFESDEKDEAKLVKMCGEAIKNQFGFHTPTTITAAKDFIAAIDHAPSWWADARPDTRHDAVFVIPPAKPAEIIKTIGLTKEPDERLASYGNIIFWTVSLRAYSRSPVVKMIINNAAAYDKITLRSSTTAKKLYDLAKSS